MNNNLQGDAIAAAIDVLNEERVIAYPTEAVFGVGCDPDSETAVMRLLELKRRLSRACDNTALVDGPL